MKAATIRPGFGPCTSRRTQRQGRRSECRRARRLVVRSEGVGFPGSPTFGAAVRDMLDVSTTLQRDPEQPCYHVAPRQGWINDPNGPLFYDGKYHLFYQHITNGCEWDFGIVWGHAISNDLVWWEHLPPALSPTRGGLDADGCFSGCAVVDTDGTPTILYTGVRLRSNPECGILPPADCDLNLPFIESQLIAKPERKKGNLAVWYKHEEPFLPLPPSGMPLVGWRDPYIFEFKGKNGHQEWGMLMGSGLKGKGGAIMIYRSADLHDGWRFVGMLCEADSVDTGAMWECPLLLPLPWSPDGPRPSTILARRQLSETFNNITPFPEQFLVAEGKVASSSARPSTDPTSASPFVAASEKDDPKQFSQLRINTTTTSSSPGEPESDGKPPRPPPPESAGGCLTHFMCISPDAPTNPVLYWLGPFDFANTRFLLDEAKGPLRLDLGDVLYAPNTLQDQQGRMLLWGWLQERRKVGSYDYAGCLSVPRMLRIEGERLVQEPIPEVSRLRSGQGCHHMHLELEEGTSTELGGVAGPALDIVCSFERGSASAAGVLIRSWHAGGEGSAAIMFDWERSMLEAIFEEGGDLEEDGEPQQRRIGGPVDVRPGEGIEMRILLDHSCVEVYLSSGEVLSTRVYRGLPPPDADAGIDLIAYGGTAKVERLEAWEMGTVWGRPQAANPDPGQLSQNFADTLKLAIPLPSVVAA